MACEMNKMATINAEFTPERTPRFPSAGSSNQRLSSYFKIFFLKGPIEIEAPELLLHKSHSNSGIWQSYFQMIVINLESWRSPGVGARKLPKLLLLVAI